MIKQGVEESFTKFVDRMKAALEKQMESAEARKEMLVKMTLFNANATTKPILRALPMDPNPTIDQMIEACIKQNATENTVAQAVAQGITQGVSGAFAVIAAKDKQRCFNCGEFRHFIAECPEKKAVIDRHKDHKWLHQNPNKWWGRTEQPSHSSEMRNEDQFPHGTKIPVQKLHPATKETSFTPRYRWEPSVSW